ncbi:MAG: hypothetical protein WD669_13060 [Pirellulales bacterium]
MTLAFFNPPLLADAGQTIIAVIVSLIVLARWIFGQIQDAKKQAARQAGQRPPQRPPQAGAARPQKPAGAAGQIGQQADPLRDQVEEFLRRSRQQQQPNQSRAAQRPPRSPAQDKIELLVIDEPSAGERRTLSDPFRPMNESSEGPLQQAPRKPRRTISSPPTGAPSSRTSVAEHVAEHISAGSRTLSQQSAQLGQQIVADDLQFDVQLKAKFDHTVGTLAVSGASTGGQPSGPVARDTPAAQIAAMLASPAGVRQAMVINEILRRPADRW